MPACVFEEEAISNWSSEDRCYFVSSGEEQSKALRQNQSKLSLVGTSREGKEENGWRGSGGMGRNGWMNGDKRHYSLRDSRHSFYGVGTYFSPEPRWPAPAVLECHFLLCLRHGIATQRVHCPFFPHLFIHPSINLQWPLILHSRSLGLLDSIRAVVGRPVRVAPNNQPLLWSISSCPSV